MAGRCDERGSDRVMISLPLPGLPCYVLRTTLYVRTDKLVRSLD